MNHTEKSTADYFAEVGMWHKGTRHLERTYVLGFLFSLIFTLAAYGAAVYRLVPADVLVPTVLILACLQFTVQVLNFLHVGSHESARDRLTALVYSSVLILALVIGSMWIMASLRERMTFDGPQMESYMQRQQGI